ncbi:hypothetical protein [Myxococcus fulvus]|nr:hypothetical protein [Myxococcus fulvus]
MRASAAPREDKHRDASRGAHHGRALFLAAVVIIDPGVDLILSIA